MVAGDATLEPWNPDCCWIAKLENLKQDYIVRDISRPVAGFAHMKLPDQENHCYAVAILRPAGSSRHLPFANFELTPMCVCLKIGYRLNLLVNHDFTFEPGNFM